MQKTVSATIPPLLVIVGPTGSGKSQAAMELALRYGGEIIAADSRTVYAGLDIGTAKPSQQDQAAVPHHGLDVVLPDEPFSAALFQQLARRAMADIRARGRLPIMAGGSGLFVDGVLFDYHFGAVAEAESRAKLERMSVEALQDYCKIRSISLPQSTRNKRHLVRTIEQKGSNRQRRSSIIDNTYVIGIAPDKAVFLERLRDRGEHIFSANVINEATKAAGRYGWSAPGLSGNIYPLIRRYIDGELTLEQTKQRFVTADWQLARRQLTWFRRNPAIHWCKSVDEAVELAGAHLSLPA